MIRSDVPFREKIRSFFGSSQGRHASDFEQIKLRIIEILEKELSKDPNLTFSSVKVQVEAFIRFPKSNYFRGSSLTEALEQASITEQLNRILKVGNPEQLKNQWIQELHSSIAIIEHLKLESKYSESKNIIETSIREAHRNGMGLSLLIKTLEKVFLRLKIDLCDGDTAKQKDNIIAQYERISEYDVKLYREILSEISKNSRNKRQTKDVSLISKIFESYNAGGSALHSSLHYVLNRLDWKSNFKDKEIVDILIDSEVSQFQLEGLMQQFSLNELLVIESVLIPRELISAQFQSVFSREYSREQIAYSKLLELKKKHLEKKESEKGKVSHGTNPKSSKRLSDEKKVLFLGVFPDGSDEIKFLRHFFVQAIISKRCLKLWGTFSEKQKTQMIADGHMNNMIFLSVLFDKPNDILRLQFLRSLTEPQCTQLYVGMPNRAARIKLLMGMPDEQKIHILRYCLKTPFFQQEFSGFTVKERIDILECMSSENLLSFILENSEFYEKMIQISCFPDDWQCAFFNQLTDDRQKESFFKKLSDKAKQKILKSCDHETLSQWIRTKIVSQEDVSEFLFDDLCADDFKKFKDFNAEIQEKIFYCICVHDNSAITHEEQLESLFYILPRESQIRVFCLLPFKFKVQIWKTFPSNILNQFIGYDDMIRLWTSRLALTFAENMEKFRNLDADFQLEIFRTIWRHLSPEQLSTLFQTADLLAKREIFNDIEHDSWSLRSLKSHLFKMWLKMDSAARKHCFVDIIQLDVIREQFWARMSRHRPVGSPESIEQTSLECNVRVDLWIALSPAERVSLIPQSQWIMESA